MQDAELVRAIRRGSATAFETLYARHKDVVFRYGCALSGRAVDAEDLLQEAFLGLVRNIDRFDARRAVRPYLLRSVRNRHLDRVRAFSARNRPLPDEEITSSYGDPGEPLLLEERTALVAQAIGTLPDSQREVVELHVFGGLSYEEIAGEQSVPAATVRTRYRAALDKLRRKLGRRVLDGRA